MPTFVPPKKNTQFIFYVSLISQANTKIVQANPTLAAGDVKVATDDAAPANLATLPVVDADFTKRVKVALSAAEMNGDNVTVIFSDAAGAEWADLTVNIQTVARQIDDLAFPVVSGRGVDVVNFRVSADVTAWRGDVPNILLPQGRLDAATAMAAGIVAAATATTIEFDANASNVSDYYVDAWVLAIAVTGGVPIPGGMQARLCTAYIGIFREATVSPAWTTPPTTEYLYMIVPAARVDLEFLRGALANALIGGRVDASAQVVGDKTGYSLAANAVDAAQFTQAAADKVWASATRTLTSFGTLVADVANAVWDELTAEARTAASYGQKLKDLVVTALGRVEADLKAIDGSTEAAQDLSKSAAAIVRGTVDASPAPTAATFADATLGGTANDHYKGRIVIFTSGGLKDQASDITAYNGTTKVLTVTELTAAPAAADTFVIV